MMNENEDDIVADDIVTELRQAWEEADTDLALGCCPSAADEIERLREIAEAAEQYHDVACNPDWCRLCRALNAWREARRG